MISNRIYQSFEREFGYAKFPFKELFETDQELLSDLYLEFLDCPLKVSEHQYFEEQGWSEEYIQMGIKEANNRIPPSNGTGMAHLIPLSQFENCYYEIRNQCYELAAKGKLNASSYCNNLQECKLIKTLVSIGEEFLEMQSSPLRNTDINQYDNDAKIYAASIGGKIDSLSYEVLKTKISCLLVENNENIPIQLEIFFDGSKKDLMEKYIKLKRHFNYYFGSRIKQIQNKETFPEQSLIAAVQFYKKEDITKKNYKEIAEKWGIQASSKLYQTYTDWLVRANRIGSADSKTKNRNKLILFNKIVEHLDNDPIARKLAINERDIFVGTLNQ